MSNFNVPTYYANLPTPLLIATGVSNLTSVFKFGFYSGFVGTERTIWDGAANTNANVPASALAINVSSDDAADTAAGTGARTVQLFGLDADYAEVNETVTLNGVTPVTTTQTFLRLNRMAVLTAGSGGVNAGPIYGYTGADTAGVPDDNDLIYSIITATKNQTLQCNYTIPANKSGLVYSIACTSFADLVTSIQCRLVMRPLNQVWQTKYQSVIFGAAWSQSFQTPLLAPAKTDVEMRAIRTIGTGTAEASASMDIILVPT